MRATEGRRNSSRIFWIRKKPILNDNFLDLRIVTDSTRHMQSVIDNALAFSESRSGLQMVDVLVPDEMRDFSKTTAYEGIVYWKPIPADITEEDFAKFERLIGFPLPKSYKEFLSYKYFIELNFGHELDFFRHTRSWIDDYYKEILSIGVDDTLNIGLIPFARETDRGWFCFDAGEPCEMNEYKIVEYDQEWGASRYISHRKQFDFMELIIELEDRLERWKLAKGI